MEHPTISEVSKNINVAIVDDHELFRRGLALVVDGFKEITVCMEAINGQDFLTQIKERTPDVVLMDLQMPVMDGIETTSIINKYYPKIKVIGFSMLDEKNHIIEMIKAGAHAYLFKNSESGELENVIRTVKNKGVYFNKYMTEVLFKRWHNKGK